MQCIVQKTFTAVFSYRFLCYSNSGIFVGVIVINFKLVIFVSKCTCPNELHGESKTKRNCFEWESIKLDNSSFNENHRKTRLTASKSNSPVDLIIKTSLTHSLTINHL